MKLGCVLATVAAVFFGAAWGSLLWHVFVVFEASHARRDRALRERRADLARCRAALDARRDRDAAVGREVTRLWQRAQQEQRTVAQLGREVDALLCWGPEAERAAFAEKQRRQ